LGSFDFADKIDVLIPLFGVVMVINLKSTFHFSWPQWSILAKLQAFPWKSLSLTIFRKVLAVIFLMLFLLISFFFLGYAVFEITTNTAGVNAQLADVSSLSNKPLKKYQLSYETVGLYKVEVIKNRVEYKNVICLYRAWPNHVEPGADNLVKVWPKNKPLIAATQMQVLGWIMSVFFLMAGLVMIINLKSISRLAWTQQALVSELRDFHWKSLLRIILLNVLVVILSVLFLTVSFLFLGYAFIEITTNTAGVYAQVADVSSFPNTSLGKYRLVYEDAGLFKAAIVKDHVEYKNVICLYPAWPNHTQPTLDDMVKVWPKNNPLISAIPMQVLGWIVSVFFLMVGLAMFEFFLLAWTIH
jgi:hypothetical protein